MAKGIQGGEVFGGMEGSDDQETPRLIGASQHGACGFPLIQIGTKKVWTPYTDVQIQARIDGGDPLEGEGYDATVEVWQCSPGCCKYERTR